MIIAQIKLQMLYNITIGKRVQNEDSLSQKLFSALLENKFIPLECERRIRIYEIHV